MTGELTRDGIRFNLDTFFEGCTILHQFEGFVSGDGMEGVVVLGSVTERHRGVVNMSQFGTGPVARDAHSAGELAAQQDALSRASGSGGLLRLAERQHQPVRPVEERGAPDHVGDRGVVEAGLAQRRDMLRPERDRRRRQRHRGGDDRVPARAEIGTHALVEQALHVLRALRVVRAKRECTDAQ